MAINFPSNPSVNDTHTVNGRTWVWDGATWKLSGTINNGISLEVSDTAPATPIEGDMWYDSSSGSTFTYYDSVWVELGNTASVVSFIADADGDTRVHVEESADDDTIRFDTAGVERLTITSAGHVLPSADVTYDLGSASYRFRDLYLSGSSIDLGGVTISSDGTSLSMPPISSVSGDFTVDTNTFHVDSSGNYVGVGTSSPTRQLHVYGENYPFLIESAVTPTTGVLLKDSGTTSGTGIIAIQSWGDDIRLNNGSVTIDSSGNVGIGTTSPDSVVHIDGGTDSSVSSGSGYLQVGSTASTNIVMDDNEIMARNNGSTATLFVNPDGGITDFNSNVANNAVSTESIRVFGIRGQLASANGNNELLHLYNNVNIGYPSGWGGQDAPQYGLHVYGAITTSTHPIFIAYPSGTLDLGTLQKVPYAYELVDRGNNYDTSLSRFTAPIDGVYQFNHRWWAKIGVTGTAYTFLYKNGSILVEMRNTDSSSNAEYETICSTYTVPLSSGDYVEIYASSPTGRFHRSSAYRYAEFSGFLIG